MCQSYLERPISYQSNLLPFHHLTLRTLTSKIIDTTHITRFNHLVCPIRRIKSTRGFLGWLTDTLTSAFHKAARSLVTGRSQKTAGWNAPKRWFPPAAPIDSQWTLLCSTGIVPVEIMEWPAAGGFVNSAVRSAVTVVPRTVRVTVDSHCLSHYHSLVVNTYRQMH